MTQLVVDIPNRADAASLGTTDDAWSWTQHTGSFAVEEQRIKCTSASVCAARAEVDLGTADHYAQVICSTTGSAQGRFGPAVRYSASADTCYYLNYQQNGAATKINKRVAGVVTNLATTTGASLQYGDVLRLEVSGSTLTAKLNGQVVLTVTDLSITGNTRAGMIAQNQSDSILYYACWSAGDLTVDEVTTRASLAGLAFGRIGGSILVAASGSSVNLVAPTDGNEASAAIMNGISQYPNGTHFVLPAGQHYCNYGISVNSRSNLTFSGVRPGSGLAADNTSTVYSTARGPANPKIQRVNWYFRGCTGIVAEWLRVEGADRTEDPSNAGFALYVASQELEHGFLFYNCADSEIRDCSTKWTYGDGIAIGKGTANIQVLRPHIAWNGRQGISFIAGTDFLVDGHIITNSRRSGIDLEPDKGGASLYNVEIRNGDVKSLLLNYPSGGKVAVDNIYIHHNRCRLTGSGRFVYVQASDGAQRTNWRVEDNTIDDISGSSSGAFVFTNVDDVSILRNIITDCGDDTVLIAFTDCQGTLTVTDNACADAGVTHLYTLAGTCSTPTISGNTPAGP